MELKHKIISFFHLCIRGCPRRNKFYDKGSISVHRSNKDYSSTYNTASISCHLPAIYHFDVVISMKGKFDSTELFYSIKSQEESSPLDSLIYYLNIISSIHLK
jgi:hypothetical protein